MDVPSRTHTTAVTLGLFVLTVAACEGRSPTAFSPEGDPALVTAAAASSEMVEGQTALDADIPSACFGGALVHLEGPVPYRVHSTVDALGRHHGQAFYDWKDVVASMDGSTWHTTAAIELYTVLSYDFTNPFLPIPQTDKTGDPAVFHHSGAIRFASDGDMPDLYIRHVVQLVSDPGGTTQVDRHVLELLDCR